MKSRIIEGILTHNDDIRNKGEGSCGKRSYATFNSNMTILLPLLLMDNRSQFKSLSAKHLAKRTVQGLIGLKHFSKARRAIVNQQRVFAIQVFELHRLIKVGKVVSLIDRLLKVCWKARRAIVNQQRVFAIQVFELHRLIKKPKQLYQRKLRHPILFLIV
ncbi:uncharacterized protein LOC110873795 isoform X2 [Helianthus annuus]|uniref:uncharacterized protein LOC110873795 isoform X2 n=1 Tax=Helianthus annuus TaxID=4232 RepID=UPI000B8F9E78|nr:uncharacterized protein LOC110873795 isoform X2 [Helianthus annuus]